ncbi:hypothetical protein DRO55_00350 [Candidatus Bathyarchaeota archaeon]|nr:MAG: hypothetical protein DRO55_00350 [Candidatus Bathyarchaeota archaeon]
MGFSTTIASAIALIGLVALASVLSATTLYMMESLVTLRYAIYDEDLNVRLEIEITGVNSSSVSFYVKNLGSKTIFFRERGYRWNSVILSYNNDGWRSYLIENYTVREIRVTGTNVTFNYSAHRYIKPGEEALIEAALPPAAPPIPQNGTVTIIFLSHYGVSAVKEGVRS